MNLLGRQYGEQNMKRYAVAVADGDGNSIEFHEAETGFKALIKHSSLVDWLGDYEVEEDPDPDSVDDFKAYLEENDGPSVDVMELPK